MCCACGDVDCLGPGYLLLSSFKAKYVLLKNLKTEIEHTQHLLEVAKLQLQRDFEAWWAKQSVERTSVTPNHPVTSPNHPVTSPNHPVTSPTMTPVSRPSSHRIKLKQAGMIAAQFSYHTNNKSTTSKGLGTTNQGGLGTMSQSSSQGLGTSSLLADSTGDGSSVRGSSNHSDSRQLSSSSVGISPIPLPSLSGRYWYL